ncbi:MAG: helix-turn-helix domain-containing protein [Xanthobacteraceae bacterium]|nr:helix-turn-helix domain-containing protein [Xanthobacteraceae bacterium]
MAGTRPDLPPSLSHALDWLSLRLDRPVVLDDLAAAAGVRPRTLEAQFKLYLGTTPMGWVRKTRLARARQQLLAAGEATNVTGVALANGFTELGRFSAHYRQAFGELPSRTLKTSRTAPDEEVDDDAVRLSWSALAAAFTVAPGPNRAALDDVERALELAPRYALPKAIAAWCLGQSAAHGFSATPLEDRTRSQKFAEEAAQLAPHDALVLSLSSGALTLARKLSEADRLIERSLAMEPWSAPGWIRRAWLSAYQGDDDAAARELQMTLRVMPFEPMRHLAFIGMGCMHFNAGRYEQAARWVQNAVASVPDSFWAERVLVAGTALMGALSEARRQARELLRKDPRLTVAGAHGAWPFPPAFMERLAKGLELAEVPRT